MSAKERHKPHDQETDSANAESEQTAAKDDTRVEVEIDRADTEPGTDTEPEPTETEQLQAQLAELEDKLLRSAADLENYKKRMARQFDDIIRTANDQLLTQLLEIVDNFERALNHSNAESDVQDLHKGTEMILSQMLGLLKKHDVTPIEAVGQPFDPNLHEALLPVESEEHPDGTVAVEITNGYRIGDRVLRHSQVGVSKGASSNDADGGGAVKD
jgi:molecular chaperone GrpE